MHAIGVLLISAICYVSLGLSLLGRVILHISNTIRTRTNRSGVLREYLHHPSYDPYHSVALEELPERPLYDSDDFSPNCPSQPVFKTHPPWSSKNIC